MDPMKRAERKVKKIKVNPKLRWVATRLDPLEMALITTQESEWLATVSQNLRTEDNEPVYTWQSEWKSKGVQECGWSISLAKAIAAAELRHKKQKSKRRK